MQIAVGWAFGEYESHILQQITKFVYAVVYPVAFAGKL